MAELTSPHSNLAAPVSTRMLQESFKLSVDELDMLRALAEASPSKSRGAVLRDLIRVASNALPRPAQRRPTRRKTALTSKFSLTALLSTRPPPDPELLRHLVRVGNLVNQVARGIHSSRHHGTPIDVVVLHFLLVVMRLELENLRDNYSEKRTAEPAAQNAMAETPSSPTGRASS